MAEEAHTSGDLILSDRTEQDLTNDATQTMPIQKTKRSLYYKMNLFQSLLYSTVHVSFQYLQYATNLKYLSTNSSENKWKKKQVNKFLLMH